MLIINRPRDSEAAYAFGGLSRSLAYLSTARFKLRPNHGLLDDRPRPEWMTGGTAVRRPRRGRVHLQPDEGVPHVVDARPGDAEDEGLPLGQLGAADLHVQEGVVDRGGRRTPSSAGSELLRKNRLNLRIGKLGKARKGHYDIHLLR